MTPPVSVLGLATAVPPHCIEQADATRRTRDIFAPLFDRFPNLAEVFSNAGIERRYSVCPLDWFYQDHGWSDRTAAYLDGAASLFIETANASLARAELAARDVDIVVTVSSTGIATPSLEAQVAGRLGLRPDVLRVPVFGLGCAGGVSGLAVAARLARSAPGATVLMVVVELCTIAFRRDRGAPADVVAAALFGDGAAAAVLREGSDLRSQVRIGAAGQHTWPDTLDIMGWNVDAVGFGVVLSQALPRFVEQNLAAPAHRFVESLALAPHVTRFICHPGGAKVLAAVEHALALQTGTLADEREVLRCFGNMSAPTVLFVLERALERGLRGNAVLSALGPGFTASFLALEAGRG
jgi:alkylresorcinol/alkylpyrone synthase